MSMELKLMKGDGDWVRLQTVGRVSRNGWKADQNPISDICGDGIFSRKVLLGMNQSNYLDSTGVEWLLHSHKRFNQEGGMLVIHSVTPVMSQILKMMRMESVLHIATDEHAAAALATKTELGRAT